MNFPEKLPHREDQATLVLEQLCAELDPYQELPEEVLPLLRNLGLQDFLGDPFKLTNELLVLLENSRGKQNSNEKKTPLHN